VADTARAGSGKARRAGGDWRIVDANRLRPVFPDFGRATNLLLGTLPIPVSAIVLSVAMPGEVLQGEASRRHGSYRLPHRWPPRDDMDRARPALEGGDAEGDRPVKPAGDLRHLPPVRRPIRTGRRKPMGW
jgi:hypothetical protein